MAKKSVSGLRMRRGRNSGILEIPTKDKGTLQYFTSLSGLKDFLLNKRQYVFFNPRSDFAVDNDKKVEGG